MACWANRIYWKAALRPARTAAIFAPTTPRGIACKAHKDAADFDDGYWTLGHGVHTATLEAKGSKFFAHAFHVAAADDAMDLIAKHADPKASHNCFAFRIPPPHGASASSQGDACYCRTSDDGEPSGSAGRPILSALVNEGISGAAVLVVRYFGGTKLGVGGLVRAYGGAAHMCLQAARRDFVVRQARCVLRAPPSAHGDAYGAVAHFAAAVRETEKFCADGSLALHVSVPARTASGFCRHVRDATAGRVEVEVLG